MTPVTQRVTSTVQQILDAATRLVGHRGTDGITLSEVARLAGVPLGLLRYHFRSPDHLLIEAQRNAFRLVHERFEDRFNRGEHGVPTALEALDALWETVLGMHAWAPVMVQTMARATHDPALGARLDDFNAEAISRVELGLLRLFPDHLDRLALPPARLARAVRTGLYGLIVELARARTAEAREQVDATYHDVRELLGQVLIVRPDDKPIH